MDTESFKIMNQDFVKLDRFDGNNFSRWQDKLKFLLTVLKIAYVLDPNLQPIPEDPILAEGHQPDNDAIEALKEQRKKRSEDEELARGHILNTLSDRLYDFYSNIQSPRELWEALEFKYKAEEEGTNKYLVSKYFDFKMVDNKPILEQVHELQVIVNKLRVLKIILPETFQVGAIIAKLPPSWKDFAKKLMHKSEDFSLDQIQKHLRIEEEARKRDAKNLNQGQSSVNYLEAGSFKGKGHGVKKDNNKFKNPGQKNKKPNPNKRKGKCHVCGETGHYARECKQRKSGSANMVEENLVAMVEDLSLDVTMISEINMASESDGWWLDSGATVHICNNRQMFKTFEEVVGQEVQMGNSSRANVDGKGTVEINFTSGKKLTLLNVLFVSEIRKSLVSVDLLDRKGFKISVESGKVILSKNGIFVGKGYACNGMYKLSVNKINSVSAYFTSAISLWHSRLGHINSKNLKNMHAMKLIDIGNSEFEKCETCVKSKIVRKPFPNVQRESQLLDLIHTDICELNGILTRGGKRYFITFIDDASRYCYVFLLRTKDEAFNSFKKYKSEVENQLEKKIKILRSDRGMEYCLNAFDAFCEENGIIHQTSAAYTPQQNGLAERKNRTFVDMINCMLNHACLPNNLWGEALLTACHILNRIPSTVIKTSPYEIWKGRRPNINYFKVWGCIAYFRVPDPKRTKLGARAIKSIFVGYAENSKAYRLLDLESNVITESRDVEFFENKFSKDVENVDMPILDEPRGPIRSNVEVEEPSVLNQPSRPRRSTRARKEKDLDDDFISSQSLLFLVEGDQNNEVVNEIPYIYSLESDPKSFKEAMASRDAAFWKEAVNDEMDSILGNVTWVLTDLPRGSKPIGCKWVFRTKYNTNGTISAFKARLVAKGFRQVEGIDYFDTYAPVARVTSIRILFALASLFDLYVHQMDVKTAFLNGNLNEEVYMEQPEGFVAPGNEAKVCKLIKSLYGLKQAPKQWHERFDTAILSFGFKYNSADRCIYSKTTSDYIVIVCLYVDDMLIISTNMFGVNETKKYLSSVFKMKDLGEVDTILGIKVKQCSGGFVLNQSHYIEKILTKFSHLEFKEVNTPFENGVKLKENNGRAIAQLEYASAIGSLMYAMHCTRPDISFAVSKLSRYTSSPNVDHWKAIGRVLGYLKRTSGLGLFYNKFPSVLEGYSDASWINSVGDNKSTSGWIFTLAGGAVSWASKKQTCISHSTMESEFIALAQAGREADWIRNMLLDINLWPNPMPPISLYCDSEATLTKAYSGTYNGKSRHIGLRHEFVRQLIHDGIITIVYVKSSKNLADPLTKPLTRDLISLTTRDMGLKPF